MQIINFYSKNRRAFEHARKRLVITPSVLFFFVMFEKSNFLREYHLLSCLLFKNI